MKEVAQSCLTPSDPMGYNLPGSSIHGIFQGRGLEWGAITFSDRANQRTLLQQDSTVEIQRYKDCHFLSSLTDTKVQCWCVDTCTQGVLFLRACVEVMFIITLFDQLFLRGTWMFLDYIICSPKPAFLIVLGSR